MDNTLGANGYRKRFKSKHIKFKLDWKIEKRMIELEKIFPELQ